MFSRCIQFVVLAACVFGFTGTAAPVIDPIPNVTFPAGKSIIIPITATSPGGQPLTYTITSNTNRIAVVMHTNNPFWQLSVAQAAPTNAPGAYYTPFRGGLVSVTNVGTMTFMLFPEYAPHAVNVFQGLTTAGFYNSNTIFHRVVTNFIIQGGDPLTNGSGGTIFKYNDEYDPEAIFTGNGQLALVNGGKDTCGSQFFVTVGQQRVLDFRYTLFGQLLRGFNVLTNINHTPLNASGRPLTDEIIQLASFVTNTTDTVITLTATNVAKITGKITVIADAGAGGRATNTFNAVTITDTNSTGNPLIFPANLVTNLVGPVNQTLTNVIRGLGLDGKQLYWIPLFADAASQAAVTNFSGNYSNAVFKRLTYNVTNKLSELHFFLRPTNGYVGPVRIYFDVYTNAAGSVTYDEDFLTFVFGDTPIVGQSNNVTAVAGQAFSSVLIGTFTNGVPGSAASNFVASINWGDNTITAGEIRANGAGQKTILGAHTYMFPGRYPVYTTITSTIGASTTVLSWIRVIPAAPRLTPAAIALGSNGFNFSVEMASGLTGLVQFSTNLKDWTTFTNFVGTNAVINLRDPGATSNNRRFYRAIVP